LISTKSLAKLAGEKMADGNKGGWTKVVGNLEKYLKKNG